MVGGDGRGKVGGVGVGLELVEAVLLAAGFDGCRLSVKSSSYLPFDSNGRMGCFFLTWSKTSAERLNASCTIFGMSSSMWLVLVESDGLSLISISHTFMLSSIKKSNPSRSKNPVRRSSFGRAAM